MRWIERIRSHPRAAIAAAANGTGVAVLIAFAATSFGYPVHHAALNDGGIWVVNQQDGYWGRFNKPAQQLDGAFWSPVADSPSQGTDLDVLQDGATVLAWDRSLPGKQLYPVDAAALKPAKEGAVTVGAGTPATVTGLVGLGGGTAAAVDPGTGLLHAERIVSSVATLNALDLARKDGIGKAVGAAAQVTVGQDGTVHAVSGATGTTLTLRPDAQGFTPPAYGRTDLRGDLRVTAVGAVAVEYDVASGEVTLPDGGTVHAAPGGVLQQPGPAASSVLLATGDALWALPLAGGAPQKLADGNGGTPAAPVLLAGTVYAAWGGASPEYVRVVGGKASAQRIPPTNSGHHEVTKPVFRVNRGAILLNDVADGGIWLVDTKTIKPVDDWPTVENAQQPTTDAPPDPAHSTNSKDAPQAVDQSLVARAGRTSVLHLLDNVRDPSGATLAITATGQPDNAQAHVAPSADLQTVSISLPAGMSGPTSFTYTISDGTHAPSTGRVTVSLPSGPDGKPYQRNADKQPVVAVAIAGTVSVPVLDDWRDPENDPVSVQSVTATGGVAASEPDGRLRYEAPAQPGDQQLTYVVTDGFGATATGAAKVHVLAATEPAAPATARDDVVAAVPGVPATFSPLDNDLPGADPAHPDAKLALAGQVSNVSPGLTATTDVPTGHITVTAAAEGTYTLSYVDAFGAAPLSQAATVRVVVRRPDSGAPVALPDQATVHGLHPTVIDVLANDYAPSGGLLGVVAASADPASAQAYSVVVVKNHWLQIQALSAGEATGSVSYTISDGHQQAVGQVSVTQVPDAADATPLAVDDIGTVRAGSVLSVPVLDNDVDPNGEPLTLVSASVDAGTSPGGPQGTAGVDGNLARYVAPASVTTSTAVIVDYRCRDLDGAQATGHLYVTVVPALAPGDAVHDQPPVPAPLQETVSSGASVTIPIPTSGVDPDGDTVSLVGLGSAPSLGRITSRTSSSLTYESFPTATGTDVFSYVVEDPYGKKGTASLQVLVLPPGAPPAPVAVDDYVQAPPGHQVSVPVLSNDLVDKDLAVTVEPLKQTNTDPAVLAAAALDASDGAHPLVVVKVPGDPKHPLTIVYGITDGTSAPSLAKIVVTPDPSFKGLPPVPHDDSATAADLATGNTSVVVDVLANDRDWDGSSGDLSLPSGQPSQQAHIVACSHDSAGCVSAPVAAYPTDVPYLVHNSSGLTAVGVLHVPGSQDLQAPRLKPGAGTIKLAAGGSTSVSLADLVAVRPGHTAKLYQATSATAAPATAFTAANANFTSVSLTATAGYQGPAALTVEVTDGVDAADPAGLTAFVTVPVQVGKDIPFLRCPSDPVSVVVDSTQQLDLRSYCVLWVADGDAASAVTFAADTSGAPHGVSASVHGQSVGIAADPSAAAGASGQVKLTPSGADGAGAPVTIPVTVTSAPPDVLRPLTLTLNAGQTSSVDVTPYLSPVLPHPHVVALPPNAPAQAGLSVSADGSSPRISVTAAATSKGVHTFTVRASDAPSNPQRAVSGTLTVTVIGKPDKPQPPTSVGRPTSRTVELTWPAPADNGAPITSYTLTNADGSTTTCAAAPCSVTNLKNGSPYTFRVMAHNAVGDSDPSDASAPVTPQAVPGAVTTIVKPGLDVLHVTWTPSSNPADGSIDSFSIETQPGIAGAPTSLPGDARSYDITTGINYDAPYVVNVIAHNAYGSSPDTNTGTVQAWDKPVWSGSPTFSNVQQASPTTETLDVSWPAADWKGPSGSYSVSAVDQGGGAPVECPVSAGALKATCSVTQTGHSYYYVATATNGGGEATPSPHSATFVAAASPAAPQVTAVTATGTDNTLAVSYTLGAPHDARGYTDLRYNVNGGTWRHFTANLAEGPDSTTITADGDGIPLKNGMSYRVLIEGCNAQGCTAAPTGKNDIPYGPLKKPSASGSAHDHYIDWAWGVQFNGRPITYTVTIDGAVHEQGTISSDRNGGWPNDDVGYSSNGHHIEVTVSNSQGSLTASQGGINTPAPPPPPPSVHVSWGGNAYSTGACGNTDKSCTYVVISWANFPNSGHSLCLRDDGPDAAGTCWNNVPAMDTQHMKNSGGTYTYYAFGYAGVHYHVWAVIDGVASDDQIDSYSHSN